MPAQAQLPWAELDAKLAAPGGAGDNVTLEPWLRELLAAPGAAAAVPSLNSLRADQLPDGALVRFVGMVQDVQDPEHYQGVYEETVPGGAPRLRTAKYRDVVTPSVAGAEVKEKANVIWERIPAVCVPLPSQSPWIAAAIAGPQSAPANPAAPRAGKRGAEESEPMEEAVDDVDAEEASKRSRAAEFAAAAISAPGRAAAAAGVVSAECPACEPSSEATAFDKAAAQGVLLKTYDVASDRELKVHEVVQVYGVLERPPAEEAPDMDDPMAKFFAQERALRAPPSAQPRVHVISFERVADVSALLLPPVGSAAEAEAIAGARARLAPLRATIVAGLASALGGDAVAAEYVLLSVLSRVYSREGDVAVGKLPLSISGCPRPAAGAAHSPLAASLTGALEALLPVTPRMALSPTALNSASLVPVKDQDANCIWPAALQLPAGSALLLDEAMMEAGTLTEKGVKNVKALTNLVHLQLVSYDFTYFNVDFPVDVSVLSISSSKTMLPISCALPLQPQPSPPPPPAELSSPQWLAAAREYLALVVRANAHLGGMAAELVSAAQDDFVAARQADKDVSADDFGRLLTTARMVAATALAPAIGREHYEHAKGLEATRKARVVASSRKEGVVV